MTKSNETLAIAVAALYTIATHELRSKSNLSLRSQEHLNNICRGIEYYFLPVLTQFSPDNEENPVSEAIDLTYGCLSNTNELPSIDTMKKLINGDETNQNDFPTNA